MRTVGFIGLGTMGMPMAINLLKNGYPLTVWNRTRSKAEKLSGMGAAVADTPAAVAREADVIFTIVSDDQALIDIVFGHDGILQGIRPGVTVIDCSTVSPETSRKVCAELAAHFADFLDAPVTGSKPAAEKGTLVFMVGGKQDVFEEQAELFDVLGSKAVYMGASGSGSYAKLAHNTIVGINAVGLVEGMAIAVKAGLDPERFLAIVTSGAAGSRQAELKGAKIVERDFSTQFSLRLMLKDLLLASRLTGQFQLPAPLLHAATALFQMGVAKGLGEQDTSSVVQCYEDWMKQEIRKTAQTMTEETEAAARQGNERRSCRRINLGIKLHLSVYQWEQEGAFSGQTIDGTLHDLSESGLLIGSSYPLAQDMFVVIHFPKEANLPPITAKIIRIEAKEGEFRYGCMLSGLSPFMRIKLEEYIELHRANKP